MNYAIYASVNDSAFKLVFNDAADTLWLKGELNKQYAFFSLARDRVNNFEDTLHTADAVTVINLAIDEWKDDNRFEIYPNPSSAVLNFFAHTKIQDNFTLTLWGLNGSKERDWTVSGNVGQQLSLEGLPVGAYYLKAVLGRKELLIKKIIVIR